MYYRYYVLGIILALLDLILDLLIITECFRRFGNTKVPNQRIGSIRLLFFDFLQAFKNQSPRFKMFVMQLRVAIVPHSSYKFVLFPFVSQSSSAGSARLA